MKNYEALAKYKLKDYEDLTLQSKNRMEPRTYFREFPKLSSALNFDPKKRGNIIDLNGKWDFKLYDSPAFITNKLIQDNSQLKMKKIIVPSPWQMAGFGNMIFSNNSSSFPINLLKVNSNNPTGFYRKTIEITEILENKDYILRFHNAGSCLKVFLNGTEVGFTKGSRYLAEFNVSKVLKLGINEIIVVCYQWSDGSFLEHQEEWQFSGLYRNVEIVVESKSLVKDFVVKTKKLGEGKYDFELEIEAKNKTLKTIVVALYKNNKELLFKKNVNFNDQKAFFKETFKNYKEWNAEDPYLYTLVLSDLENTWFVPQKIGFREIKVHKKQIILNGKPIFMRGIDFHAHNSKLGLTSSVSQLEKELKLMKKLNINAIRTSHYPQIVEFYDLCDKLGFYVIEEADLDAHGFDVNQSLSANDSKFEKIYLDRATRMVQRDKNHPSIIMWSLGNKIGFGPNFINMAKAIRKMDATRLLQYQGDFECEVVDVSSNNASIVNKNNLMKPHIEYRVASEIKSIKDYFDFIYHHNDFFAGVFISQWSDYKIEAIDHHRKIYKKYVGDFATNFNKEKFCQNGLILPNGKPSPLLLEYKEIIAPIKVTISSDFKKIQITNNFDFQTLNSFNQEMIIIDSNGKTLSKERLDTEFLMPKTSLEYIVPDFIKEDNVYYWVQVVTTMKNESLFANKDYLISLKEFELPTIEKVSEHIGAFEVKKIDSEHYLKIVVKDLEMEISKIDGQIHHVTKNGIPIIQKGPKLNFKNHDGTEFFAESLLNFNVHEQKDCLEVIVETINGLSDQSKFFISKYKYKFFSNGMINFRVEGQLNDSVTIIKNDNKNSEPITLSPIASKLKSELDYLEEISTYNNPKTIIKNDDKNNEQRVLSQISLKLEIDKNFKDFQYFGKGAGEFCANTYNLWKQNVDSAFTRHAHPQKINDKHQTLWTNLINDKEQIEIEIKANGAKNRFDFSLSRYDDRDLINVQHSINLIKRKYLSLNIGYNPNYLNSDSTLVNSKLKENIRDKTEQFVIDFDLRILEI